MAAGLELHVHDVFPAFGVHGSPSLPIWDDVELSSEVEPPRCKHRRNRQYKHDPKREHKSKPR